MQIYQQRVLVLFLLLFSVVPVIAAIGKEEKSLG